MAAFGLPSETVNYYENPPGDFLTEYDHIGYRAPQPEYRSIPDPPHYGQKSQMKTPYSSHKTIKAGQKDEYQPSFKSKYPTKTSSYEPFQDPYEPTEYDEYKPTEGFSVYQLEDLYDRPIADAPTYNKPAYQPPIYGKPVYKPPLYSKPVYKAPVYSRDISYATEKSKNGHEHTTEQYSRQQPTYKSPYLYNVPKSQVKNVQEW